MKIILPILIVLLFALNANAQKGKIVIPKGNSSNISCIAISADKKLLASAAKNVVVVYDIASQKELYRIDISEIGINDKIDYLRFSADNKKIFFNSYNNPYDILTGKVDRSVSESKNKLRSNDGKYVLEVDENYYHKTIEIFENKTGTKIKSVTANEEKKLTNIICNNDRLILYGTAGWVIFNISTDDKKEFAINNSGFDIVVVDEENNRIAFTERFRDVVEMYDLTSGKLIKKHKVKGNITNLAFNVSLVIFEYESAPNLPSQYFIEQLSKNGLVESKNRTDIEGDDIFFGEFTAKFNNDKIIYSDYNKLKIFDGNAKIVQEAFPDKIVDFHSFKNPTMINQQQFSDTSFSIGVMAKGNAYGGNIIFDKDVYRPKIFYNIPGKLIYSPDYKLVAGIENKRITVANNLTGKIIKEIKFPEIEFINSTSTFFSEIGTKIFIANYPDNGITEVDIAKGTLTKYFALDQGLTFSNATGNSFNGKYLAAVAFNTKNENFKVVIDVPQKKIISKQKINSGNWEIYYVGNTLNYILHDKKTKEFTVYHTTDATISNIIIKDENWSAYLGYNEAKKQLAFCNVTYTGIFFEFHSLDGQLQKSFKAKEYISYKTNFTSNGTLMYAPAEDKGIEVWDTEKGSLLGTYYFLENSKEYVFISPDGLFDGSPEAVKELYYVKNYKAYSLDKFFEKFYTPNLLLRKKNGEDLPVPNIDDLLKEVTAKILYAEAKRNLEVSDDKPSYSNTSGVAEITVNATAPEDKVDEIRLFHNGKAVNLATRGLFVADADGAESKKYTINLLPGANSFRAIALNSQRTESEPDEIVVNYKNGDAPAPKPNNNTNNSVKVDEIDRNATLHIVVVGINAYKGKINPLTYALPDATAFKTELEKDAKSVIGNVKSYLIADDAASKSGIVAAFENIKKSAKPEDVFVFYYAGHGYIHPTNKEFYLVSSDVADGGESLLKNGVSSKELQTFAVDIPAQKQLFIMDACQSAGAFEAMLKHDGEQQKALAVVSRSTGTHWMAASGSTETAKEFGELGHGVFTYSLLEALKGKAVSNKMITVNGLKNYLQTIVPELVKKYGGNSQYPASYGYGNDFPVELLK